LLAVKGSGDQSLKKLVESRSGTSRAVTEIDYVRNNAGPKNGLMAEQGDGFIAMPGGNWPLRSFLRS